MSDFDELMAVLDLHPMGDDVFIGSHPSKNPPRTFGGLMMAQSFVAGSRTLTRDLPPNALSAHFINGGDTAKDIEFQVVRLRDERRFANRRIEVTQDGTLLATVMISYLAGGRGLEHNVEPPEVADPETLPSIKELLRGYEDRVPLFVNALQPIEWRYTNDPSWVMRDKGDRLDYNRVWVRADGVLPDDPGAAHRDDALLLGHHRAGLDHHHSRALVGVRPHLRCDRQSLGLVSSPGQLRRLGVVFHILAGGHRLTRAGERLFLRPRRPARRHRRARRRGEVFPRVPRRRPAKKGWQRFGCGAPTVTAAGPVRGVTLQVVG